MWHIPGVIESNTCLLPMITRQTSRLIKLYKHYKNSVLMHGGGIMEQSNFYLEAMEVIDKSISE